MQAADRARQVANVLTPFLAAAASSRHLARAQAEKQKINQQLAEQAAGGSR